MHSFPADPDAPVRQFSGRIYNCQSTDPVTLRNSALQVKLVFHPCSFHFIFIFNLDIPRVSDLLGGNTVVNSKSQTVIYSQLTAC